MKHKDTPLPLVQKWACINSSIWDSMDKCYAAKSDMMWSDYCHIPIGAAHTVLRNIGLGYVQCAEYCAELTAAYIWRKYKVCYQFDSTLASTLAAQAEDMDDEDKLPVELLMHLPFPCIYIKCTSILDPDVDGFFVWIEYDINRNELEFRIQYVVRGMRNSVPAVLHLIRNGTIKDCIESTNNEISKYSRGIADIQAKSVDDIRMILAAIQMVLYLVSDKADVQDEEQPKRKERKPCPKLNRKASDKASSVQGKQVGVNVGRFIRNAKKYETHSSGTGGTGASKRPHARRGHFHHYWIGAKGSDDRQLILKWTAPTFIHCADGTVAVYNVAD